MPRGDFESLTPLEQVDLYDAWETRERFQDYRFGLLTVLFANTHCAEDQEPWDISDLFPRCAEYETPQYLYDEEREDNPNPENEYMKAYLLSKGVRPRKINAGSDSNPTSTHNE